MNMSIAMGKRTRTGTGMLLTALLVLVSGCPAQTPEQTGNDNQPLHEALGSLDATGYAQATSPRTFRFPQDHGAHPDFRNEWWYFTGNVTTPAGRPFGFELTLFRIALSPQPVDSPSPWHGRQIYMGHLALSDIAGGEFQHAERLSRTGPGLAGAEFKGDNNNALTVWLEDWQIHYRPAGAGRAAHWQVQAMQEDFGIELELAVVKPLVLQGEQGLSQKGAEPGNASYYYAQTRLAARGAVRLADTELAVTGQAWMDREWSTSALGEAQIGWDWFALQLDSGAELMLYQLRQRGGRVDPHSEGSWVTPRGERRRLQREDFSIEVLDHWDSPRGGRYPSRWRITVAPLELAVTVTPRLADQELDFGIRYWEGSVAIDGKRAGQPVAGLGYVELTGYAES